MRVLAAIAITLLIPVADVVAHPGRTASDGCHYCRTNCSKWGVAADRRHCHGGSSAPAQPRAPAPTCPAPTGTWRGLRVAAECRCSPYDRDDYDYPASVEARIAERLGGMFSPYDGTKFESLRESWIEHIVALSEAHDSGLCAASDAVRRRFASDLDNLTLATPTLNRAKSGRDAAEWMPEMNRCWFAAVIVAVRLEYGLTIDRREAAALDEVFAACEAD